MSGAGKTTAARQIAARYDLPYHEMDALAFGPNWSTPPGFIDDVEQILIEPRWVFDSWGYPAVRDAMWAAADTVIWLDYPRRVVLPRLARRCLRRSLLRTRLFGGNRERWRDWLSPDHPLPYAVRNFADRRAELAARTTDHTVHRFRRPAEFDRWLQYGSTTT